MALTKIGSGGIENVTNAANATFLTIDASEQITFASEGGAVTTSLQQGLAKVGIYYDLTNNTNRQSWNVSSVTDHGTGNEQIFYTNNVTGNAISVYMASNGYHGGGEIFGSGSNSHYQRIRDSDGTLQDSTQTHSSVHGDLA